MIAYNIGTWDIPQWVDLAIGGGGGGTPDNKSIIKDDEDKLAVSYGGKFIKSLQSVLKGGFTTGTMIAENIYEVTSTETPDVTEFFKHDYLEGTLNYGGYDFFIEEKVRDFELNKGTSTDKFIFAGIVIADEIPGMPNVKAYFGIYDKVGGDKALIIALTSGDASAVLSAITLTMNLDTPSFGYIKPEVIPMNIDTLEIDDGNKLNVKGFVKQVTTTTSKNQVYGKKADGTQELYDFDLSGYLEKNTTTTTTKKVYGKLEDGTQVMLDYNTGDIDVATTDLTIDFMKDNAVNLTCNITNGKAIAPEFARKSGTVFVIIRPDAGYVLPATVADITVENATIDSYDTTTGRITISSATDDVTVSATCPSA